MVQLALGARVPGLVGHVVVRAKSGAAVPLTTMLLIVRAVAVLFVNVLVSGALVCPTSSLPKLRLSGLRVTPELAETPVPLKTIICGLSEALSPRTTLAPRVLVAAGLNETVIVQEAPTASVVGQLFD